MADRGFEERLAEAVRGFPLLYDKSDRFFKDKQKKELAWRDVAEQVGLKTGEDASNAFKNLRNRYSRDKRKVRDLPSGSGSSAATSAGKQTSAMYSFLQWLDPYVTSRSTTTNIRIEPQKSETDEDQLPGEEQEDRDDDGISDLESTRCLTPFSPLSPASPAASDCTIMSVSSDRKVDATRSIKPRSAKRVRVTENPVEKAELDFMNTISTKLCQEKPSQKDEEALFGDLIATQLRQLSKNDRLRVKMQINNIIYSQLLGITSTETIPSVQAYPVQSKYVGAEPPASTDAHGFRPQSQQNQSSFCVTELQDSNQPIYRPGYFFYNQNDYQR